MSDVQGLSEYSVKGDAAMFNVILALVAELPYKTAQPIYENIMGQLKQQELDAAQAREALAATLDAQTAQEFQNWAKRQQSIKALAEMQPELQDQLAQKYLREEKLQPSYAPPEPAPLPEAPPVEQTGAAA